MQLLRPRVVAFAVGSAVGLVALFSWEMMPPALEGYYKDDKVPTIGFTYWKFWNGKVEFVTDGEALPWGTYTNHDGGWIWTDRMGARLLLRRSGHDLRVLDPDTQTEIGYRSPLKRVYVPPELTAWLRRHRGRGQDVDTSSP